MCMVLSTSIMDEIPKIFVLREENYHQELKRGGGYAQVYVPISRILAIRQGKFLFSIFKGLGVGSN